MDDKPKLSQPLYNVELLSLSSIDSHLCGVIRTRWLDKNLEECDSIRKQMMGLLDVNPTNGTRNPWLISMNTIALAFGCEKWEVQRIIEREKRIEKGQLSRKPGCPLKITSEHLKAIKEFICKHEVDEKDTPEPYEVCDFIESTLGIIYS